MTPFKTATLQNVRFVLLDIEGTISDVAFVRKVLFPYSAKMLRNYVSEHRSNPTVRACVQEAATAQGATGVGAEAIEAGLQQLLAWIASDTKHPALKTLQGLIWREGYEAKAFRSHLYGDVITTWQRWRAAGLRLGIYSSGSRAAQDLFFHYSEMGDVRSYLEAYFDLSTGGKREAASYTAIASALDLAPSAILFLSDVAAELDAARAAGFKTGLLVREGHDATATPDHPQFHSLADV